MKYILFLSLLTLSFSLYAAPYCSKKGTRVFYTNGVTTTYPDALTAAFVLEGLGLNNQIDSKKFLNMNLHITIKNQFLEMY